MRVLHAGDDDDRAAALLDRNPDPTTARSARPSAATICRCTGYENIVRAIRWAAEHAEADIRADQDEEVPA